MKKIYFLFLFSIKFFAQASAPAAPYYNATNWNLTGNTLKTELANLVNSKHTNFITYSEVWNATKITDLDLNNSNNVLLLYGWENGTDPDVTNDLVRNKNSNGGNTGQWNREHVYAKSLATPNLEDNAPSDAGEDAHHLRSCDVQRNNTRGSLRFADGSGNSKTVTGGWYPGDQWKGDVARMMMYMYLRYGNQCLPKDVARTGSVTVSGDTNMVQLFLEWNAEDPVDAYEDARNTYHGDTSNTYAQGNRNPFIDNPYLATRIWGGVAAEDRWTFLSTFENKLETLSNVVIYPNPTNNNSVTIFAEDFVQAIEIINLNGQIIQKIDNPTFTNNTFKIENLNKGFYFFKLSNNTNLQTKKVLVN